MADHGHEAFLRGLMGVHICMLTVFSIPAVLENNHSGFLSALYVFYGLCGLLTLWPTRVSVRSWLFVAGLVGAVFMLLFAMGVGNPRGMTGHQQDAHEYALISSIVMTLLCIPSAGYLYATTDTNETEGLISRFDQDVEL